MTLRDDTPVIDREHPWPWLDAFPESARDFFNGRDEAAQQLLRCVLAAPATVLFGKSGLGKTSLLQAGLSPLLREEQLLPVLVRLTHQDAVYQSGLLSSRLLARLDEEIRTHGLRRDGPLLPHDAVSAPFTDGTMPSVVSASTRLWELLHDTEACWLDAHGEEWTPVFILDQFEEVFTLVHDPEQQQRLFSELGNLIQNRTPAEVAERRKAHGALRRRLDPERLGARFVLSLREDYLPDLEIYADRIPRLGPNRYRLLPMSQVDALQAISTTGGALVDTADAERIVQFLDQQNQQPADASRPRAQRRERIEPALLSLVCAGLNQHRIDQKAAKLDTRSLDQLGGQLLEQFYDRALAALPEPRREAAARFVETELITLDGTRRPFPEVSLAKVGLTADDIAPLKDKRLLRTENTEHGAFVELVHDRLAAIAAQRAVLSRKRAEQVRADAAAAESARRKQAQRRLFARITAIIFAVTLSGLGAALVQWLKARELSANLAQTIAMLDKTNKEQKQTLQRAVAAELQASAAAVEASAKANEARAEAERARRAEADANRNLLQANAAKRQAQASARDATAQRVLSDANDAFGGINRVSTGPQSLLMTLAGHRVAQESTQTFVQTSGYAALQREVARNETLIWLRDAKSGIRCIAFSSDGTTIVSGEVDGTLRLWDASSGRPIGKPLIGHSDSVWSVAFSPDGKRIVSGSQDKTLRLWDVDSGLPVGAPLLGHSRIVTSVAFSRDGYRIISGSSDKTLRLWDARLGLHIGEPFNGHSDAVISVAFSRDGARIVSGSQDKTLRLWDTRSGLPIGAPLKGHSNAVSSVAFSPNGARVVSGSADMTLRLWDANLGIPIGEPLSGHSGVIPSVAFSPDGTRIASGSWDKTVRLWETRSGTPVGEPLRGHSNVVWGVAFNHDGTRVASGSGDKTIRLWAAHANRSINEYLEGHSDTVWSVAFSPDGKRIISGSRDNTIRLWDTGKEMPISQTLSGHWKSVFSVAFSPDGRRIVSGSQDETLRIWDTNTGLPIGESLKGHSSVVSSVAFSPDGIHIVSGSYDKTVRLWNSHSGLPIREPLTGHSDAISSVAFSPDGMHIVSGSHDKTLRLWSSYSNRSNKGPPD